ncbi:uncharacterized protein LOC106669980 isoform X1 [Cimex lectularius]|uniref:G/T mismatch-specific thymine DNA glycosylase n=1 Tax=Cimex lectularius TaxID=79782 RepID=A0A8I6S8Y9_CIMLE|nr:uncharacterized protein LOC106669980 isoform X1 [Cimex lectularius]
MQVATLFREATTLLGAGMEAPEGTGLKLDCYRGGYQENGNGLIKTEPPHDDGYETAGGGDVDIPNHHHVPNHMGLVQKMGNHPIGEGNMIKYEMQDDPYSFVDDDHMMAPVQCPPLIMQQAPKKRGRKKKIKTEELQPLHSHNQHGMGYQGIMGCLQSPIKDPSSMKIVKERKKHDRFNGMPEEEVSKRTLPDHLTQNLDIVIIGINPGLFAAYKGHHYAGPGNHFWKCLYLSGLTPEPMTADDDYKLLKVGIGFTNMVERATKGSADLTRKEIKEGSQILLEKLQKFKPKIAVFNGKLIFEVFSGKKDFSFGRQPELVDGTNTYMWVMPSSSARCAQLPRAADKVPFYAALKKFRDYLNGAVPEIDDKELVFSYSKLKNFFEPEIKEEGKDGQCVYNYNKVNADLTDISNLGKKDDEPVQPKKKRGRPKKIKVEGEQPRPEEQPKPKVEDKQGVPKKKRGRPKKIKVDNENIPQPPSEHSNPPNHCFSPPIQSPNMQNFPLYQQPHYNQSSQSPLPTSYHQSPMQSHGYNQSPQPPSFTHSDLSSEISAAISSEQNPESPALGPPDFDPPVNLTEEVSKSPNQKDDDCHFSSPQSKKSYQNYDDFSTDSDSGVRYPPKQINQDVSSKSLSGLESLVDQIPNITDNDQSHTVGSGESEHMGSQYSEDSAYLSDYPRSSHFSPQYNTSTSNSYMQQHSNFSVTSLANSSATDSTFSVSSLAGSYTPSTYANVMGPPMSTMIDSNPPLFTNSLDRACRIDSSVNIPPGNPSIPYPYPQYSNPYSNASSGFYPTTHNLHMPGPNFPYPGPYSNSSYPQSGYLPNHMFDRIKPDRMDIGFGSF